MTAPAYIPRGTVFDTKTGHCRFRTVYDVVVAPVRVTDARYLKTPSARSDVKLPADTSGLLSLSLETVLPSFALSALPPSLRLYLNGSVGSAGTIVDAMLLQSAAIFVEGDDGRWTALPESPIAPVGFGAVEELLGAEPRDGQDAGFPFRLFSEYFAFPAKFSFVDLDIATIVATAGAERRVTLHIAVSGVPRDSWTEQRLSTCSADSFRLFCTPVVNLFAIQGLQVKPDEVTGGWPIAARKGKGPHADIWSVDDVTYQPAEHIGRKRQAIPPLASLSHSEGAGHDGPFWIRQGLETDEGRPLALSLVGIDGKAVPVGIDQLNVDVTCSNGVRPSQLETGKPDGDMKCEKGAPIRRVVLLSKPTLPASLPVTGAAAWKIIAQFSRHPSQLSPSGLEPIKAMLRQFATLSTERTDFVDRICALKPRAKHLLIPGPPAPSIVRGLELILVLDEYAFAGKSMATFGALMERFFASYLMTNEYLELLLRSSNTGVDLWQGKPRSGCIEAI
jgi:type VI secretion system protein ImpG